MRGSIDAVDEPRPRCSGIDHRRARRARAPTPWICFAERKSPSPQPLFSAPREADSAKPNSGDDSLCRSWATSPGGNLLPVTGSPTVRSTSLHFPSSMIPLPGDTRQAADGTDSPSRRSRDAARSWSPTAHRDTLIATASIVSIRRMG